MVAATASLAPWASRSRAATACTSSCAPYSVYLTEEFNKKMHQIEDCVHCDACKSRCPYGLDIPNLLQRNLEDWNEHWANREKYLK